MKISDLYKLYTAKHSHIHRKLQPYNVYRKSAYACCFSWYHVSHWPRYGYKGRKKYRWDDLLINFLGNELLLVCQLNGWTIFLVRIKRSDGKLITRTNNEINFNSVLEFVALYTISWNLSGKNLLKIPSDFHLKIIKKLIKFPKMFFFKMAKGQEKYVKI